MRKFAIRIASFGILLSSFPYIAVAAASNSDNGTKLPSEGSPTIDTNITLDIIKVFIALAVVIALLMFTVKWLSKRNRVWTSQRGIRTLGGVSLGQQSSVQVIELANVIYVLGVGEQVTLLDKEDNPEKVAKLIASMEIAEQQSFSSVKQFFSSLKGKNEPSAHQSEEMWKESSSFEDLLQTKLDKQAERKQELESLLKDNK